MRTISVQDLHERTDEVVTAVHQDEVPFVLKSGDRLIALLSPLRIEQPAAAVAPSAEGWESYERLAEEVRRRWPEGDGLSLLDDIRGRS